MSVAREEPFQQGDVDRRVVDDEDTSTRQVESACVDDAGGR
jgi:hypothetical protein